MPKITISNQLEKIRKDREALDRKERALLDKRNQRELATIVKLANSAGLTIDDIANALGSPKKSRRNSTAKPRAASKPDRRRSVAPKYRNPSNPAQTWTGRGLAPVWIRELRESGRIDSALIAPATA